MHIFLNFRIKIKVITNSDFCFGSAPHVLPQLATNHSFLNVTYVKLCLWNIYSVSIRDETLCRVLTDHRTVLSNGIMWFISHHSTGSYGRRQPLGSWNSSRTADDRNIPAAFQLNAWLNAAENHFERDTQRIDNEPSEGTWGKLSSVTNIGKVISRDSKARAVIPSKSLKYFSFLRAELEDDLHSYAISSFET